MMSESERLLISAYAGGDVAPRQIRAAEQLMEESAEARRLYRQLRTTQSRLHTLSLPELPFDFTDRVLKSLPEQAPIIRPSTLEPQRSMGQMTRRRLGIATSIALTVALGSFVLFTPSRKSGTPDASQANVSAPIVGETATAKSDADPTPKDLDKPAVSEPIVFNRTKKSDGEKSDTPKPGIPSPNSPASDPLGNVPLPLPKLVHVAPPRLLALPLRTMDSVDARQKLKQELDKATSHHIDLFCKDTNRGLERFQVACRDKGIRIISDSIVQEALKRKIRGQYLIYSDEFTAKDWTQLLQILGVADKKAEDKKPGDGNFDHAVVMPIDSGDKKELTSLFGSDLLQVPAKPIAAKERDIRTGVATALLPWKSSPNTKEIRQFLDDRRSRPNGSIAVVLVIRSL